MMLPFQQAHYEKVPLWENKIPWPYLDSHRDPVTGAPAPILTVGIGCATCLDEMLTLPFSVDGAAATPEQITAACVRVMAMPGARVAGFYQYDGCLMLAEQGIAQLVQKRYDAFTAELVSMFPDFLTAWPMQAQEGALDLIWGLGEGHPATAQHVATGLCEYTHWLAYAKAHDWAECAETCGEDVNVKAFALRNAYRKQLFLDAANGGGK